MRERRASTASSSALGARYPDWLGRRLVDRHCCGAAGLVGVASHYAAFLLPAALLIFRPRRSRRRRLRRAGAGVPRDPPHDRQPPQHVADRPGPDPLRGRSPGLSWAASGGPGGPGSPRPSPRPARRPRDLPGRRGRCPAGRPAERCSGRSRRSWRSACLLYVFGHAPVDGQEAAKFVGGLGSALLFAAVGGGRRPGSLRHPWRGHGVRPGLRGPGDLVQPGPPPLDPPGLVGGHPPGDGPVGPGRGVWRRRAGWGLGAFAALRRLGGVVVGLRGHLAAVPRVAIPLRSGDPGASLFPVAPLADDGGARGGPGGDVDDPGAWRWPWASPRRPRWPGGGDGRSGPPTKFPMNPTYALLGAVAGLGRRSPPPGPIRRWRRPRGRRGLARAALAGLLLYPPGSRHRSWGGPA